MDNISMPPQYEESGFVGQFKKLPKWAQLLATIGIAIALIAVALIVGNKYYYQVSPLHPLAPAISPPTEQPSKEAPLYSSSTSILPPSEHLPPPPPVDSTKYNLPFDEALASAVPSASQECSPRVDSIDDMATSALATMGKDLCTFFVEKGTSIIEHPLAVGSNAYYDNRGIGIMSVDNKQFLVSFYLSSNISTYQIVLNSATVLSNISKISSFTLISAPNTPPSAKLLAIVGENASGNVTQLYFGQRIGRYADGNFSQFVEKNADGTFSSRVYGSDTDPAQVSFLVPLDGSYPREIASDRDEAMETQNEVRPIYHKATCGLEESYGDVAFLLNSGTIAINFGYQPILHITTATYGYTPEQWGKILKNVAMDDFRGVVQEAVAARSTAPVEMLSIGGYGVKHTGPITADRSCQYSQNDNSDMYQAVKNGAVVTITAPHDPSNQSVTQKMVEQVLTSLVFSPR